MDEGVHRLQELDVVWFVLRTDVDGQEALVDFPGHHALQRVTPPAACVNVDMPTFSICIADGGCPKSTHQ